MIYFFRSIVYGILLGRLLLNFLVSLPSLHYFCSLLLASLLFFFLLDILLPVLLMQYFTCIQEYVNLLMPPLIQKWNMLKDEDKDLFPLLEVSVIENGDCSNEYSGEWCTFT